MLFIKCKIWYIYWFSFKECWKTSLTYGKRVFVKGQECFLFFDRIVWKKMMNERKPQITFYIFIIFFINKLISSTWKYNLQQLKNTKKNYKQIKIKMVKYKNVCILEMEAATRMATIKVKICKCKHKRE